LKRQCQLLKGNLTAILDHQYAIVITIGAIFGGEWHSGNIRHEIVAFGRNALAAKYLLRASSDSSNMTRDRVVHQETVQRAGYLLKDQRFLFQGYACFTFCSL
jgi:hypothetical protein